MTDEDFIGTRVVEDVVRGEWIDFNGHMNVAYYVLAFDLAIDELWSRLGITDDYIRHTQGSTFAVESHVTYQQELKEGEPYVVTMQLLAYDEKRIHHFQRMYHRDQRYLAATAEWMSLHVDLGARKVTAWPASVLDALAVLADEQSDGVLPDEAGKRMQIKKPIYKISEEGQ